MPQVFGIGVKFFGSEEELKVAGHMADDESEQDDAGDRHHHFLADGVAVEARTAG